MSRSYTKLSADSLEIVRHMSGPELQDLAERGVHLPGDARRRLVTWQEEQAVRMREQIYAAGELDRFSPPGSPLQTAITDQRSQIETGVA